MKPPNYWCRFELVMLIVTFAAGCAANITAPPSPYSIGDPETPRSTLNSRHFREVEQESGAAPQSAPGIVVHIDPATGRVLPIPSATTPAPGIQGQALGQVGASVPPVFEQLSTTPGGGVMVKLNRQFHTPLIATIDSDGKVVIKHGNVTSASSEEK
jgi:hypothetical protein